jgi:hypothetical protein
MIWLWATAAALDVVLGLSVKAPVVFQDERTYWILANRIAENPAGGLVAAAKSGYGVFYPALIAPVSAIAGSPYSAYAATKVVNSVILASAAVPVFLIARRVLPKPWAFAAAALTVAGPQAIFGSLIMTENVAFPAFLWVFLAVVRALERPTPRTQLLAVLAIALSVSIRMQAIVFVPGFATAIAVVAVCERSDPRRLRRYATTAVVFAALASTVALASAIAARSPLGAYGVLLQQYSPVSSARWAAANLADIDLLLGIAMFAAAPFAVSHALRARTGSAGSRSIAAALIGLGGWSFLMVSAFSASHQGEHRVHERYLVYFVPAVIVLCLRWVRSGSPAPRRMLAITSLLAAMLPAALPLERMGSLSWVDSFASQPWLNSIFGTHQLRVICIAAAIVIAGSFTVARRRAPLVMVGMLVLTWFLAFSAVRAHSQRNGAYRVEDAAWIDKAVGARATVDAVFVERPCLTVHQREARWTALWRAAFFNRSVRLTYFVGRQMPGERESLQMVVRNGVAFSDGTEVRPRYVLVEPHVGVAGVVVRRYPAARLTLVRPSWPLRLSMSPNLRLRCRRHQPA